MARRFLTLNVGSSKVVLAEYGLAGKHNPQLVNYGTGDIVPVDSDMLGSMTAALTPVLLGIMRDTGIKPGPVHIALSGQMVFPRFVKLPPVEASKLEQMVRYEVEQNVPFPMDEIVWDKQFTGASDTGEETAVIVAAKIEHVRGVTDAVAAAGLEPEIVDVAPMAVGNAFRYNYPELTGCTLLLDIGARTTNLVLLEGGKTYCRSIPVAGNAVTKELAQAFGCSQEEAEQLKISRGYVSLGGMEEDPDEISDRTAKTIRSVMNRLNAEISRSVNFYRSQQGGNAPERVMLAGGGSRMTYIDNYFAEVLNIEAFRLEPFRRLSPGAIPADRVAADSAILAESAGLALRAADAAEMKIDLLPPEITDARRMKKSIPMLAAGAILCLAGLGVCIAGNNKAASGTAKQLKAYKSVKQQQEAAQGEYAAVGEEVKKAAGNEREVAALFASRSRVQRAFDAVRHGIRAGETNDVGNVMWIRSWKPYQDGTGATVEICGWSDNMKRAKQALGNKEVREVVRDAITASKWIEKAEVAGKDPVTAVERPYDENSRARKPLPVVDVFSVDLKFAPDIPEPPKAASDGGES